MSNQPILDCDEIQGFCSLKWEEVPKDVSINALYRHLRRGWYTMLAMDALTVAKFAYEHYKPHYRGNVVSMFSRRLLETSKPYMIHKCFAQARRPKVSGGTCKFRRYK